MKMRNLILAISLILAACSTASDKLNEKLANQTPEQRLVTLQNECAATAKYYRGTLTENDPQNKYLLGQTCANMSNQIKRAQSRPASEGAVSFRRSYEACVDESKSLGSTFTYRGSKSSKNNGAAYYYHARAICDAFKKMAEEKRIYDPELQESR